MLEDGATEDLNPDEATDMGGQRFASMSMFDAPVFLPPDPMWLASVRDTARKQLASCQNVEDLLCGYIELLGRAKALVDFWENNVGPTIDWPLSVTGESEEVEECLQRRVHKLQVVVGFMEERACS